MMIVTLMMTMMLMIVMTMMLMNVMTMMTLPQTWTLTSMSVA